MTRIAGDKQSPRALVEEPMFDKKRYWAVMLFLLLIVLVMVARMAQLQLMPNQELGYKFLQKQGELRQVRNQVIPASRGLITDRNHQPLAVSVGVYDVWMNPEYFDPSRQQLSTIAKMLGSKAASIRSKQKQSGNKQFVYLKRQVSPDDAAKINSLEIPGLFTQAAEKRFYPAGEVSAQIVGITNTDQKGIEGIELLYNEWLKSTNGERKVIKDLTDKTIDDLGITQPPKPGEDLQLTLDMRVQYFAYKALKQAVINHGAQSAQSIVVDVQSGEILAMVSQPSFNPNNRKVILQQGVRNRVVSDMFEPGSTMKPLTVLAALKSGKYTLDSVINTHPGTIRVGNKTFDDPGNYGVMSLGQLLKKSSQVGTVKIALELTQNELVSIFRSFGIGSVSGIGFADELSGGIPVKPKRSKVERANLGFGYGLKISAIQLAKVYSIIANDGQNVEFKIVKNNAPTQIDEPQIIQPETARAVRQMLTAVTTEGGTAPKASIAGYNVAGKSGTTHKVIKGSYDDHSYRAIFVGMAPAERPQIVTVVVIDNPTSDEYSGGAVAAPVFSAITQAALRYKATAYAPSAGNQELLP